MHCANQIAAQTANTHRRRRAHHNKPRRHAPTFAIAIATAIVDVVTVVIASTVAIVIAIAIAVIAIKIATGSRG